MGLLLIYFDEDICRMKCININVKALNQIKISCFVIDDPYKNSVSQFFCIFHSTLDIVWK